MKISYIIILLAAFTFESCAPKVPTVAFKSYHAARRIQQPDAAPLPNTVEEATPPAERADAAPQAMNVAFFKGSFDELLQEARRQKKAIFLDFMATWCGPCKQMDAETFANNQVASVANRQFLAYKVDIDWFEGMDIADRYRVIQFPTVVFLDSEGRYIDRVKGFQAPDAFSKLLQQMSKTKGKDHQLSSL